MSIHFRTHHGKQQSELERGTFRQKMNQLNNLPSHKNDEFLPPPEQLLNKQTTRSTTTWQAMSTTAAKQARHDH